MSDLVPMTMAFPDMEKLAAAIAKSGLFGLKTPEQALVMMAIAQAEGRHPALAARDYDIIQGRPAKKAEAMLRDFVTAGGRVEWHALNDELADATFTHPQTGSVRIDWDLRRARTAGLLGKDMYIKFPRQMLRSRVISEGVRTLWPLATSGMYVPEEAAAIAPHNGPTLEHTDNVREGDAQDVARMAPPSGRDTINAEVPLKATPTEPPPSRTRGQYLDALSLALNDAQSAEEADRIMCSEDSLRAKETFTGPLKERYDGIIKRALEKWFSEPPLDEVEIVGQDKLAAG